MTARAMADEDNSPISAQDAKALFADWKQASAIVLAVSGGPDSVAMMWLAARWRRALKRGPRLVAVTVDHGLRREAAREAGDVKRLAKTLAIEHQTLRWRGVKPTTGLPAAAREARYRLLAQAARTYSATHILTAHTRDDQAESLLMRLSRGSGLAGLAAMARLAPRDGVVLARPMLDVPKARLLATLHKAKIAFATDPTNQDHTYTRPRFRALMPALAAEGCDARNLARLAGRLARANASLEIMADGAERFLAARDRAAELSPPPSGADFDAKAFAGLPDEIRVRLLLRTLNRIGHEGPAEFGKVEALASALDAAGRNGAASGRDRFKQTLAGALIVLAKGRISITPAPPRRRQPR
jgi:tRNA(Ile)-lysidine synthase